MSAVSERGLSDPHRVSGPLRSEDLPDDELLPRPKGTALWWPLVLPEHIDVVDNHELAALRAAALLLRRRVSPARAFEGAIA